MCLFYLLINLYSQSSLMFNGELESLKSIRSTRTVYVPRPIATGLTYLNRTFLVVEHLNLTTLDDTISAKLGKELANMHMVNILHEGSLVPMRFI